jgi:hypothetical protein
MDSMENTVFIENTGNLSGDVIAIIAILFAITIAVMLHALYKNRNE